MDAQSKTPSHDRPPLEKPPGAPTPLSNSVPIDIEVHGLKAKVFLNRPQEDIVPARYLEKADRSSVVQHTAWVFRCVDDARQIKSRWSKVDVRFRGVFRMLKSVPQFEHGLYQDGNHNVKDYGSGLVFKNAARAQGQVVYALLDEILNLLDINREMDSNVSHFFLRARLWSCNMEYWTGYRQRHQDAPLAAGLLCVDSNPPVFSNRPIIPISTTTKTKQSLESALEGKFKLLLSNFLLHIYRLYPPGDRIPDQEVFLIGLHGSRLHVLRAIFPGYKTSKIWSGRYNPPPTKMESSRLFSQNPNDRFYSAQNIERLVREAEWHKMSNADGERNIRVFRILGSKEYDLWIKSEFREAVRLIVGLTMYLMSGHARCGVLQHAFQRSSYDEDDEPDLEDKKGEGKAANEEKNVSRKEKRLNESEGKKLEEDQEQNMTQETMRSPSWNWVV